MAYGKGRYGGGGRKRGRTAKPRRMKKARKKTKKGVRVGSFGMTGVGVRKWNG